MRSTLILIFITTLIFTIAVFLSTHFTGADHSTLTQCWFTVVGVEIGGLLLKKILEKDKKTDNETEE